ncbi:hypothetical protein [Pseudomonas sp. H9]|uniref:hypothetical protein n=1 Tax=Pseudomonas sp. H9 TaxID=483968 RepID=UPI001057C857|nr:hypothetical protein [Pseudomonas sp. H9]TDF84339.1 hypothetical protein E1573_07360 [Pseudomonas sp. H9]
MSQHDFQLTYSIPETLDGSSATARDKMREYHGWDTVVNIDTTLTGQLPLQGIIIEKRKQAEREVKKIIKDLLEQSRKNNALTLHASLMVCGLGEHIRFDVSA